MAVIAFQASRLQKEAGLVVAGRESQIIVSVLPKLWRRGGPQTHAVTWPAGRPYSYVELHEGDTCCISCSDAQTETVYELLRVSSEGHDEDVGSGVDSRPLLELTLPPEEIDWEGTAEAEPSRMVGALVNLAARGGEVHYRDGSIFGRPAVARTLQPLLCDRFLDEVEQRVLQLRRSYVSTEERISLVRGRVIGRDLLRHIASGDPSIGCRFDFFTEERPLFRVIASALDVVARGAFDLSALRNIEGLEDLPRRAARLRRLLGRIRSLPPASALVKGRSLVLDRLTRSWKEALDLALQVLKGLEYLPDLSKGRMFPSFELGMRTSRVWERILETALRTQIGGSAVTGVVGGGVAPSEGIDVWKPWSRGGDVSRGRVYPDLFIYAGVEGGIELWCVDAKYKTIEEAQSPNIEDLYQIFAYSHLSKMRAGESGEAQCASHCALIYPSYGPMEDPIGIYRREPVADDSPYLHLAASPFPQAEDVASSIAWQNYLRATGARLVTLLGLGNLG